MLYYEPAPSIGYNPEEQILDMARTEPRAYLRFVVDEWPLIEAVFERSRQGPLQPATIQQLASELSTPDVIQRLQQEGIITQLPDSPAYEMGEFIQGIITHLRKEHTLGLAKEIRIYLEDMEKQTNMIVEALDVVDFEKLHRHAENLANRIKSLQRHLHNNAHALHEMVERAKTRKSHTPLKQRYGEVLEAWENYVEPVQEMADPAGPFESLFERLERELQHAMHQLHNHGYLVSDRRNFQVLLHRLMALRTQLTNHFNESRAQLLPLVRQVRRNSMVARGASIALKKHRNEGVLPISLNNRLPINRRRTPTAISSAGKIEQYLADMTDYTPEPASIVWQKEQQPTKPAHIPLEEVLEQLKKELPVHDLFDWLIKKWGETADTEDLLDVFFSCQGVNNGIHFEVHDRCCYETNEHYVRAPRLRVELVSTEPDPSKTLSDATNAGTKAEGEW